MVITNGRHSRHPNYSTRLQLAESFLSTKLSPLSGSSREMECEGRRDG